MIPRFITKSAAALMCLAATACGHAYEDFQPQSFDELSGHTIALMEGSVQADYAEAHCRNNGVRLLYFPNHTDGMIAVRQGRADILFANSMMIFNDAFKDQHMKVCHIVDEIVADTGFGFRKGNDELVGQMNVFLDSLRSCGDLREIEERWMSDPDADPHDLIRIDPIPANPDPAGEGRVLKVGVSGSKPPSTMLVDNMWTGFEIELLQKFAAVRGYQLQIMVFDFHNLIPSLTTGTIDIAASTMVINDERKQKIDFSDITFRLQTAFISRDPDYVDETGLWSRIRQSFYSSFVRESRWRLICDGLKQTVIITLFALIFGSILGGAVCWLRMSPSRWRRRLAIAYIYVMRNTPMLVFLMIMFYVVLAGSGLSATAVAIAAFSMNSAAFIAEICRSGIQSVSKGQTEASRALGCTAFRTFFYVVAPQAARNAAPVFTNECVTLLKGTSIVGYISIIDLTKASDLIRSTSFEAFLPLIMITLIYFVLASLLSAAVNAIMRHI